MVYTYIQRQYKEVSNVLVVCMYQKLVGNSYWKHLVKETPWMAVVLDEGHWVKNEGRSIFSAVSELKRKYSIIITGMKLFNKH